MMGFRRAAVLVGTLLACTHAVRAATTLGVTADNMNTVVSDFLAAVDAEAEAAVAPGNVIGRRLQSVETELSNTFKNFNWTKGAETVRSGLSSLLRDALNGTMGGTTAAGGAGGASAGSAATGALGSAATTAVATLTASLGSMQAPMQVKQAFQKLDGLFAQYCQDKQVNLPKEIPASWTGPSITLSLQPQECEIHPDTKQLDCTPAYIQLEKDPGVWNHKFWSPFQYISRSCKIEHGFGNITTTTFGGAKYTVPFSQKLLSTYFTAPSKSAAPGPATAVPAGGSAAGGSTAGAGGASVTSGGPGGPSASSDGPANSAPGPAGAGGPTTVTAG